MSKNNNKETTVVGSKHIGMLDSASKSLNNSNDISSILFEKQKNAEKEALIEKYAGIYQNAIVTLKDWEKKIEELAKPDKSFYQAVEGTSEEILVSQTSTEKYKQRAAANEKYKQLCELFDTATEKSSTENYNKLQAFLSKNKI